MKNFLYLPLVLICFVFLMITEEGLSQPFSRRPQAGGILTKVKEDIRYNPTTPENIEERLKIVGPWAMQLRKRGKEKEIRVLRPFMKIREMRSLIDSGNMGKAIEILDEVLSGLQAIESSTEIQGSHERRELGVVSRGPYQQNSGQQEKKMTMSGRSDVITYIPFEDSPFGMSSPGGRPQIGWENYIQLLEELGVHWVGAQSGKIGISWGKIQTSKDSPYNWSSSDNIVKALQGKDINFFSTIYPVATWDLLNKYSRSEIKFKPSGLPVPRLPVDLEAYSRFVEAVVERYDGDGNADMPGLRFPIRYWMTISEPDNYWGDWNDTAENYAILVRTMYEAMKKADPRSKLVIHGSAGGIGGGAKAYKKGGFIHKFYRKLKELTPLEKYEDFIWGFHYTVNVGKYLISEEIINANKRLAKDFGYDLFPIWVTETGTFSGNISLRIRKGKPLFQSQEQQAGELVKRFIFNMAKGANKIFWVRLVDSSFEMGPFKGVGLLTLDGKKKLSYYTYRFMTDKMEGCNWGKIETIVNGDGGVYAYRFLRNGKSLYVVWSDHNNKGRGKILSLNMSGPSSMRVTSFVPEAPDSFKTELIPVKNGKITITLDKDPLLIEPIN